jgi:tRNA A37 threonylcarbamoyltransferase TsaD
VNKCAQVGNPKPLTQNLSGLDFSFRDLKLPFYILSKEKIRKPHFIANLNDICASIQNTILKF